MKASVAKRWSRALRTPRVLLVSLFGLHLLTVGGVLIATRQHNASVVTRHAQDAMQSVTTQTQDRLRRHLQPAQQLSLLLRDQLERGVLSFDHSSRLEQALLSLLRAQQQVSSIFVARPDGSFLFVQRRDGGYFRKHIQIRGAARQVELLRWSSDLRPLERTLDEADRYQPQTRAWYQQASATLDPVWTAPYVFFTSGRLGITSALARRTPGGKLLEVIGVDIQLDDLARFLEDQPIGQNGKAFLATEGQQLITVPDAPESDGQTLPRLEQVGGLPQKLLGQPPHPDPQHLYSFSNQGEAYLGMLSPLELDTELNWRVGIYAPRRDFTGPLEQMNTLNLLALLGGGTLILLLSLPLLRSLERPFQRLSRFENVFEQALHLRALLRPDGTVLEVNAAALEALHLRPSQVRGRAFESTPWWSLTARSDLERLAHGLERAADGHTTQLELNLSPQRLAELSLQPLRGTGGEVDLLLVELRDVTELRRSEATLERMNLALSGQNAQLERRSTQLAEADAFKSRVLGMVSHDLKNPIALVSGFADLLGEHLTDPQTREWTEQIVQASQRMNHLVSDLLDHTALELKVLRLEPSRLDFSALVSRGVEQQRHSAEAKRQRLDLQIQRGVELEGDERRLSQVLENLLSNAIKFSPSGASIRVRLHHSRRDASVYLAVQDEGPGLSSHDQEQLFGVFQTLSARPTAGESSSGLGLALAKQMTELHGGSLSVDSREGQGATFTVRLPSKSLEHPPVSA